MLFCVYLLTCFLVAKSDVHSLMAFVTYIAGQTPFPEFSAVLMLDDVQIGYYDSVTWKPVYSTNSTDLQFHEEEQKDADIVFRDMYNIFKERAFYLKEHQNHKDGIQVHQRIAGCELLNNDKPGLIQRWDALDGQNIEEFIFDIENNKTQTKITWQPWDQQKWIRVKYMYENVYHPLCMKVLRRYLYMKKNNGLRKVKPRVRFMNKTLSDSRGLQISCLATGFYPRHINMTLFRDGQPVNDDQITGGQILPNGDGTYQMRKSLMISEEELCEEHKYNCTINHLSLDNKLDITIDVAECDPVSFSQSVVFRVLVFMFVVAVFIIIAVIIWRKRRAAGQGSGTSQSKYSPTPYADRARLWLQAMGWPSAPDTSRMFVRNKLFSRESFYRHKDVGTAHGGNLQREDAERSPKYLSVTTGQPFHLSCWLEILEFCPVTAVEGGSLNMVIGEMNLS